MKKLLGALMVIIIAFSCLSGCEAKDYTDKIKIVTTVFPCYDFARAIAGDNADITMLVRPGSESHSFEPTPADMKKTADCDAFIMRGGESEDWAVRLAEQEKESDRVTVKLNEMVTLLEADHHHGQNAEYDEHIWTSPQNAVKMCRAVCDAICSIDPENKEYYESNFEKYKREILTLDDEFKAVSQGKNKTLVFGDRFPFLYFVTEYSLNYKAAFPGCAEESEPDINTLLQLIEFIKEENISTVFYTEFSSGKTADMLVSETNAEKRLFHSCHNVTKEEWERGETYVSLMKNNLEVLKEALK